MCCQRLKLVGCCDKWQACVSSHLQAVQAASKYHQRGSTSTVRMLRHQPMQQATTTLNAGCVHSCCTAFAFPVVAVSSRQESCVLLFFRKQEQTATCCCCCLCYVAQRGKKEKEQPPGQPPPLTCAATALSKPTLVLSPVPTAVPPCARRYRAGSAARTRAKPYSTWVSKTVC